MLTALKRRVGAWLPPRELGVAVAPDRLVAVTVDRGPGGPRPERVYRRRLEDGPSGGEWPELERALGELRGEVGDAGRERRLRVHAALLPPLSRTKALELPDAGRAELRRLVARDLSRHFLRVPDDPVADAVAVGPGSGGPVPAVAGCAAGAAVEAVLGAVEAAGLEAGLATAGAWAAAEGARAVDRELRSGAAVLELVSEGGRRELRLEDGRLRAVTAGNAAGRPAGDGADPAVGGDAERDPAPATSAGAGPEVRRIEAGGAGEEGSGLGPGGLAAFGVAVQPEDGLQLLSGPRQQRWARRLRSRAGALGAAAVALLVVAGGVHLWGLEREIEAVEAARSALEGPVSRASTTREAADRMSALLASLGEVRPERPGWASVVAEIARALPASSYLEELSVADRGLVLSGSARSPSALITRLEDAALFEGATLENVSRSGDGEPDAFRIVVRIAGRNPGDGAAAGGEGP